MKCNTDTTTDIQVGLCEFLSNTVIIRSSTKETVISTPKQYSCLSHQQQQMFGPHESSHLRVKFDNPSLSYSWWNLSVQCNTCCLGKNVFGWDNSHQKNKNNCPPLICTHASVSRILYMYTKQQNSVQLLPETKQLLAWLHPCCPGPTSC